MSQKTIGLICAIPQERVDLKAALDHQETVTIAGLEFDHGRLGGQGVIIAEAGIGKVNTSMVATLLASRFGVDLLAFSGVAGGLDPALAIGDLVIAERAIQHDCGVIEDDKLIPYQAGHVPFFNPTEQMGYDAEPAMLERIETSGERVDSIIRRSATGGDRLLILTSEMRFPLPFFGQRIAGAVFLDAGQVIDSKSETDENKLGERPRL